MEKRSTPKEGIEAKRAVVEADAFTTRSKRQDVVTPPTST